jgi:hypothetical protein
MLKKNIHTFFTILLIILLIVVLIYHFQNNKKRVEPFEQFYQGELADPKYQLQFGITDLTNVTDTKNNVTVQGTPAQGSIVFPRPYKKIPMIFTQIIGGGASTDNLYSIQVYNVSLTGFDYKKNMIGNIQIGSMVSPKLGDAVTEQFYWMAISS